MKSRLAGLTKLAYLWMFTPEDEQPPFLRQPPSEFVQRMIKAYTPVPKRTPEEERLLKRRQLIYEKAKRRAEHYKNQGAANVDVDYLYSKMLKAYSRTGESLALPHEHPDHPGVYWHSRRLTPEKLRKLTQRTAIYDQAQKRYNFYQDRGMLKNEPRKIIYPANPSLNLNHSRPDTRWRHPTLESLGVTVTEKP